MSRKTNRPIPQPIARPCVSCGHLVSPTAATCPHCGHVYRVPAQDSIARRPRGCLDAIIYGPIILGVGIVFLVLLAKCTGY